MSTPDVNLLDANTAHTHQGLAWQNWAGCKTLALDSTLTPIIGDFHLAGLSDGAQDTLAIFPLSMIPVSGSTEYSVSAAITSDQSDMQGAIGIAWYDIGVAFIIADYGVTALFDQGEFDSRPENTVTSPAGAVWAHPIIKGWPLSGQTADDDAIYADAVILREGADTTFVASNRIVGDLEVEIDFTPRNALGQDILIAIRETVGLPAWQITSEVSGAVFGAIRTGGANKFEDGQSSASILSVDTRVKIKVTRLVGDGQWEFFVDDVTDGTDAGTSGIIDYQDPGDEISIGAHTSGTVQLFDGDIYWATVRDGVGGPIVAKYDADDAVEPFATQTGAVDGRTWTYNRSGSGLYVVDQASMGLHTDDYFVVADDDSLDFIDDAELTLMVLFRKNITGYMSLAGKGDLDDSRYEIGTSTGFTALGLDDATNSVNTVSSDPAVRILSTLTGVRSTTQATTYLDGTPGTPVTDTTLDLSTPDPFHIGRRTNGETGLTYVDGEIMAVALWRFALTDEQIAAAGNALAGSGSTGWNATLASSGQLLLTG
jgi:hypothetical protein